MHPYQIRAGYLVLTPGCAVVRREPLMPPTLPRVISERLRRIGIEAVLLCERLGIMECRHAIERRAQRAIRSGRTGGGVSSGLYEYGEFPTAYHSER